MQKNFPKKRTLEKPPTKSTSNDKGIFEKNH